MRTGIPEDPSVKHGSQMSGPPKANVSSALSASEGVEENGAVLAVTSDGMPTYFVTQRSLPASRTAT